ncbi:MAG: hypothetical protein RL610_735 [Pseudomonadota bacterium]|jgi:hypothetical protein
MQSFESQLEFITTYAYPGDTMCGNLPHGRNFKYQILYGLNADIRLFYMIDFDAR